MTRNIKFDRILTNWKHNIKRKGTKIGNCMKKGIKNEVQHPGKLIAELLKKSGLNQADLALRTGVTEKHVCTLLKGDRDISPAYAKKLEYVFNDVKPNYFYEKQQEYDLYKHKQEEINDIDDEEHSIFNQLKEQVDQIIKDGQEFIDSSMNEVEKIIGLRKFLKVSKLSLIPTVVSKTAFRLSRANVTTNHYVLYMWIMMCEYYGMKIVCNNKLDIELLKKSIPEIKKLMLEPVNAVLPKLINIFNKCGIRFDIVHNFKGAPGQGFIKMLDDGTLLMCVTIRGKRADTFWFTLFHEISHILNGDAEKIKIDLSGDTNIKEQKADEMASDFILDREKYRGFVERGNYSEASISSFAHNNNIPDFMLIGRLQKDRILEYSDFHDKIKMYEWVK